jgi:SAM-dependent methyltransferase
MYKPRAVPMLDPAVMSAAAQVYRPLVEKALTKQHNEQFRTYLATVLANNASLQRHLRAFRLYAPYLKPRDVILDWGCRHSPDSCFIRSFLPDAELHGCDTSRTAEGEFEDFFAFSRLEYTELSHVFELPYASAKFDVVLSSGVLEHVAFELESTREIWRVLKPKGLFVITFLPNYYSLSERASRLLKTYAGHNRLYRLSDVRDMLLRRGFLIERSGYHQLLPTFAKGLRKRRLAEVGDLLLRLNDHLDGAYPLAPLSSNLFVIARKVDQM